LTKTQDTTETPVEDEAAVEPAPFSLVRELDYGEAARFFTEAELIASYSEIQSTAALCIAFLEFSWSAWKVWTSF